MRLVYLLQLYNNTKHLKTNEYLMGISVYFHYNCLATMICWKTNGGRRSLVHGPAPGAPSLFSTKSWCPGEGSEHMEMPIKDVCLFRCFLFFIIIVRKSANRKCLALPWQWLRQHGPECWKCCMSTNEPWHPSRPRSQWARQSGWSCEGSRWC